MTRKATDQVTTIGIDIGKNSFHLIGLDGGFGSAPAFRGAAPRSLLWGHKLPLEL